MSDSSTATSEPSSPESGPATPELTPDYFNRPLAEVDPEVAEALRGRARAPAGHAGDDRLRELRARARCSNARARVLTNKYAEGYPGRRYYGGCEWVDVSEQLAIDRAKALFGAEHANVQPHAGAQANTAVYHALLEPGDTIMGLSLAHGGHLTHGMKLNVSGRLYEIAAYEVDPRERAGSTWTRSRASRASTVPKLLLAGWSAYPRQLDFARFREIADEVGALLMVDMAHFAGLVAAGLHPSPVALGADVVTTTTHKTLGGPARRVDPLQGGVREEDRLRRLPRPAGRPAGARDRRQGRRAEDRQKRAVPRAPAPHARRRPALAEQLLGAGHGVNVLTGGTDVHLVLADLRDVAPRAERPPGRGSPPRRSASPSTATPSRSIPRPPMEASGLRIGTPALATRGLQHEDFVEVGQIIAAALTPGFEERSAELAERVRAIVERYPLYEELRAHTPV